MEKYKRNPNGQYYLPIEFTSSMSLSTHFIYILIIIAFIFSAVYFNYNLTAKSLLLPPIGMFCGICTFVQWIFYGVLKLGRIEIDEHELVFKTITCHKRVPWEKVNEMGTKVINGRYGTKSNVFHIGLNEDDDELPFIRKFFAKLFGLRAIPYSIPMNCFPDINRIKLMRTINGIMKSHYSYTDKTNEDVDDIYPEDEI